MYSLKSENSYIKRIPKGEKYSVPMFDEHPQEDKRKWRPFRFDGCEHYIAKEDRWKSDSQTVLRTVEEVVEDYNNSVMYDEKEDKWYNRPMLEVYMCNKEGQFKIFFNTDDELFKEINDVYKCKNTKEINLSN